MKTYIKGHTFEVKECAELCSRLIENFGYNRSRKIRAEIEVMQKTINYLQKWKDKHETTK
jgi:hypothetical protein